ISAAEGTGLDALVPAIEEALLDAVPAGAPRLKVYRPTPAPARLSVKKGRGGYVLSRKRVESIVARADINNPAALTRMRSQLDGLGLREALLKAGAQGGDTVVVGGVEFV